MQGPLPTLRRVDDVRAVRRWLWRAPPEIAHTVSRLRRAGLRLDAAGSITGSPEPMAGSKAVSSASLAPDAGAEPSTERFLLTLLDLELELELESTGARDAPPDPGEGGGPLRALAPRARASARPIPHPNGARELAALGIATVDRDRFGAALPEAVIRPASDDPALGAAASLALVGGERLLLLEPSTEGRVAAALARHGEGPIAFYIRCDWPGAPAVPESNPDLCGPAPWPLGRTARLVRPDRPSGPFVVLVIE